MFNNNEIRQPINGDGTTPYAIGYFGAPYGGGRVTGEIKDNCILATSSNHIDIDHVSDIDAGTQTVTEGGDNVAISGNDYGNCGIPLLPNLNVTPGALYGPVRQSTIAETICKRGWSAKIRAVCSRLKTPKGASDGGLWRDRTAGGLRVGSSGAAGTRRRAAKRQELVAGATRPGEEVERA